LKHRVTESTEFHRRLTPPSLCPLCLCVSFLRIRSRVPFLKHRDESHSSSNQNLIVHKCEKKCWIWSASFLQFRDNQKDDHRKRFKTYLYVSPLGNTMIVLRNHNPSLTNPAIPLPPIFLPSHLFADWLGDLTQT